MMLLLAVQDGWNPAALVALLAGVLPNIPGFLVSAGVLSNAPTLFVSLFSFAWFVGFIISAAVYSVMMLQGAGESRQPRLAASS